MSGPGYGPEVHGHCDFDADSFGTRCRERRGQIAAAGAVAEAVFHHGPRPTFRRIEALLKGGDDEQELRHAGWRSLQPASATFSDVLPVVLRCWTSIGELAKSLYFGHEVDHQAVCRALGLADGDDGGPYSLALHQMIRNGSAPRTAV